MWILCSNNILFEELWDLQTEEKNHENASNPHCIFDDPNTIQRHLAQCWIPSSHHGSQTHYFHDTIREQYRAGTVTYTCKDSKLPLESMGPHSAGHRVVDRAIQYSHVSGFEAVTMQYIWGMGFWF